MRNIRLLLQYDGSSYHGWQIQPRLPTLQGKLTQAVKEITGAEVQIHGSGRTDAGTHALGQVCNFHTLANLPLANFQKALNSLLPFSIRILDIQEVPEGFHSRRDARWKHYRYRIMNSQWCSPFDYPYTHHYARKVDFSYLNHLAEMAIGEHDFTSFCDSDTEMASKVRRIYFSFFMFDSHRELIEYNVCANGFLHHMVRNLIGTFLEMAKKNCEPKGFNRILELKSRSAAGPTAPAKGLFLVQVGYEDFPSCPKVSP